MTAILTEGSGGFSVSHVTLNDDFRVPKNRRKGEIG